MTGGTFAAVVRRDLLLAARQRADVANTLLFFLVVVTMVPLGVGPEINTLRTIAPGVVWVAALLAAILSLNRLFAADFADGTLEQMVLSGEPLPVVVLAKALAHWLTTGLPITVMAVLLGVMFDLPGDAIGVLVASPHARAARRRRADHAAGAAAVRAGADLRRRRGRGGGRRTGSPGPAAAARCAVDRRDRTGPVGNRGGPADIFGIIAV